MSTFAFVAFCCQKTEVGDKQRKVEENDAERAEQFVSRHSEEEEDGK